MSAFATFVGFTDVFGRSSTSEELTEIVSTFRRSQLLIGTAKLALRLESWYNEFDPERQDRLIAAQFPISSVRVTQVRRSLPMGIVFSRLGLLYFTRQIIECSSELGRNIAGSADEDRIGGAILMCNDLYLEYTPTPHDSLLQMAAGFLPAAESIPNDRYFDEVARSLIMMTTILERPEVSNSPDYLNLEKEFKQFHGLQPIEFFHLVFGLVARLLELAENDAAIVQGDVIIRPGYFSKTRLDEGAVARVLHRLSSETDDLRSALKGLRRATDFAPIQARPLLRFDGGHLCLDATYVFEKAGRAFFWMLRDMYVDEKVVKQLMRLWGRIFESYHDWIWEQQFQREGKYLNSPSYTDGSGEIADAVLLENSALLLFECKASIVTSQAKYSYDGELLGAELRRKFVEDATEKARAKGVGQLARAVRHVCGSKRQVLPFTLNRIERIYTVLVTLDPIVQEPFIRQYLDEEFHRLVADCDCRETITPLFSLHIADLERLLRYTNVQRFEEMLRTFARGDTSTKYRPGAIAQYVLPGLKAKGLEPGLDTVGLKIEQMIAEFQSMFRDCN